MKRVYGSILTDHFRENRQMAFISGPRQVGKTTTSMSGDIPITYLNWDRSEDRRIILKGASDVIAEYGLNALDKKGSRLIFDEIHKFQKWKSFIKGFFDSHGHMVQTIVTGSARLNVYKQGGDSLMGRYFPYRMHPVSLAELEDVSICEALIRIPQKRTMDQLNALNTFGGFPEPLLKANRRFYNRWRRLRSEQLFQEDIRDLTNIFELKQLSTLAELIQYQTGQLLNYSSMASSIAVSVDTVRRWIGTLESVYYCFTVRPWFTNVPKSLRRQPKIYLWDWSLVNDDGARNENLVASHLHKAVHFWTDAGFGDFGLYFLRDKAKREVDFLVTRDSMPWFLVEVKSSTSGRISRSLDYYHQLLGTQHAFQVEMSASFVDQNCFEVSTPIKVPALTFLSQLV